MRGAMRTSFRRAVVVAAGAGLALSVIPASAGQAARRVPAPLFGQHVATIASGTPETLAEVGAVRLWDSNVQWRDVETARGDYNWPPLDRAVANAQALGASEILYTLGSTPRWAASVKQSSYALYGPGSNSHPADDAYYLDYLRAVAQRYKGRITSYQVWNEANLRDFYLGTPTQMAKLTVKARAVLKSVDPGAKLVAASTTVRAKGPVGKFGKAYGKAMKKVRWPVDAVSAHFYPPATSGPGTRVSYIKKIKKYYKRWGAKRKPLWDTEMNYGDTRSYMKVKRMYTGSTAATYVARTFIDSMRYGVSRVFWYGWDINVLGTDMVSRSDRSLTAGGRAFLEVKDWMTGAKWYKCKVRKRITTCKLKAPDGTKMSIRYTTKKTKKLKLPKGSSQIRYLDGTSTAVAPRQRVRLTTQPVLLVGA